MKKILNPVNDNLYGASLSKEAFLKLVTHCPESEERFRKKLKWRQDNEVWLKKSANIAIKVLSELRKQELTKEELASDTNISIERINEIVKGSADITLREIYK